MVQITDMDAVTANYPVTGGAFDSGDEVCVYTNDPNARYKVNADGDGGTACGGVNYCITDGADDIAYTVQWKETAGAGAGDPQAADSTAEGPYDNGATATDCSDGTGVNAYIRIQMTEANILAVDAGTYTGVLTVIVTPDDT